MKKYIGLFIAFQILDIITTIIGVCGMGFIELNKVATLPQIIFFKVLATILISLILIKIPERKMYNILWILSALPVVWNIFNIIVEITL